MRRPLLLVLLLSSTPAHADPKTAREEYVVAGQRIAFLRSEPGDLLLSEGCRSLKGRLSCRAFTAAQRATLAGFVLYVPGGTNPGMRLCQERHRGVSMMGEVDGGGQISFCVFPDGSMLSNAALLRAAKRNDRQSMEMATQVRQPR